MIMISSRCRGPFLEPMGGERERESWTRRGGEKKKERKKEMTDRIEIKASPGEVFDHPVGAEQ